jgi:phosphoglycerate dehydrogenase-like enzyme
MRERTPLPRSVIERLPRLKLIASTGPRNAAIDVEAAAERGIVVAHTGYNARPTIEMTWALILASARQVALENAHLRAGGWQLGEFVTFSAEEPGQILSQATATRFGNQ